MHIHKLAGLHVSKMQNENFVIVPFAPQYRDAFRSLNLAWITAHWDPEPEDFKLLDHPEEHIIEPGGHILFALIGPEVVGTCALVKTDAHGYELAKMAVAESARGHGIGLALGQAVIEPAKQAGATRVFLESNTILEPAIALYRKLGFEPFSGDPSPYERANIQMELYLSVPGAGSG